MCKSLISLLYDLSPRYKFDVNYLDKLALNNKYDIKMSTDNLESLKYILIKSLAISLNSLSIEENTYILEYFEEQVMQPNMACKTDSDNKNGYVENLTRLTEFMSYVTCEIDLSEDLKNVFSEFVQKLLIQLQPVYMGLKSSSKFDEIVVFLKFQTRIIASKYVRI